MSRRWACPLYRQLPRFTPSAVRVFFPRIRDISTGSDVIIAWHDDCYSSEQSMMTAAGKATNRWRLLGQCWLKLTEHREAAAVLAGPLVLLVHKTTRSRDVLSNAFRIRHKNGGCWRIQNLHVDPRHDYQGIHGRRHSGIGGLVCGYDQRADRPAARRSATVSRRI